MPQHKKGVAAKALKKRTKRARMQRSKLESTLDLDLVESRDRIEGELATVRPQFTHKIKRKDDVISKKKPTQEPTPKTKGKNDPLNPLNESRKQLRDRTGGKSRLGPGPAGPGIERRAKAATPAGTKSKLLALIAQKRAAQS